MAVAANGLLEHPMRTPIKVRVVSAWSSLDTCRDINEIGLR